MIQLLHERRPVTAWLLVSLTICLSAVLMPQPVSALSAHQQTGGSAAEEPTFVELLAAAEAFLDEDQLEEAIDSLRQAVAVADEADDVGGLVDAQKRLATAERRNQAYEESIATLERLLLLQEELSDFGGVAETLALLGANHADLQQVTEALDYYEQAVIAAEEVGNSMLAIAVLSAVGDLQRSAEDKDAALVAYNEALAMARKTKNVDSERAILETLGGYLRSEGDYADANDAYAAALVLRQDEAGTTVADLLALIGANYAEQGEIAEALAYYTDAVDAALEEENPALAIAVLRAQGDMQRESAEDAALNAYRAALTLAQESGDVENERAMLETVGNYLRVQGEYADSNEALEQALALRQADSDLQLADLLALIGANYAELEDTDEALDYYDEAVRAAEAEENPGLAIAVLRAEGDLRRSIDDDDALLAYEAALALAREHDDVDNELALLETVGNALRTAGEYAASNEAFLAAVELRQDEEDAEIADLLALIGANYAAAGTNQKAFSYYDDAIAAADVEDNPDLRLAVMAAAGDLYAESRQIGKAIESYRAVLAATKDDPDRAMDMLTRIANLQRRERSYAAATASLQELLVLQTAAKDQAAQAQTLALIGANAADQGDLDTALGYYERAIAAATQADDATFAATVQMAQANALLDAGRIDAAVSAFREAAVRYRQLGSAESEVVALQAVARAVSKAKDGETALAAYDDALAAAVRGRRAEEAVNLTLDKANLLWGLKRQDEAWDLYDEALAMAREGEDPRLEATALFYLSNAHSSLRHYEEALTALEEMLALAETHNLEDIDTLARRQMWFSYLLSRQVEPALQIPNISPGIYAPEDGAVVRGDVLVEGLAQGVDFRKWQLDLLIEGAENNAVFLGWSENNPPWSGGRRWGELLTFDSSLYPNGAHQLRLRIVSGDGNYDEYLTDIEIRN